MSMPFYVSPEQLMKDRADFARKGIARGRSVVVVQYADGVLFASENPSQALHKVSEIYDRIAFAAVGRYNEFENLRIAGVRLADMRGYAYDRRDVTGRGLANAYAQTLGTIFSSGGEKPYEVELFVAEIGDSGRGRPDLPADLPGPGHRRAPVRRDGRRRRGRRVVPRRSTTPRTPRSPTPSTSPWPPSGTRPDETRRPTRDRVIPAGDLEVASSTAPAPSRASSSGWSRPASRRSSATAVPPSTPTQPRGANGTPRRLPSRGRPRRHPRRRPTHPGLARLWNLCGLVPNRRGSGRRSCGWGPNRSHRACCRRRSSTGSRGRPAADR